jgi:antirestriction protein
MRVYIASLSDYNNGRLEGKWFDLSDYLSASDLMNDIHDMLLDLTEKYNDGEVREEWAVHDYEGIPPTLASEYMGEADFEKLMDIRKIAEDRDIPVEVLVERAGDTGSDDYEALADSLVMVVDGSDETDIVYELENQMGELGNEFWSRYIFIDDVTERVMYGEDVDRFREDILYENPDMDEDEAERQAEEMADEEAERREDLSTYLQDMGYGDEIPNFVSKDYNDAWKHSLSYDYDVIHHDDQMYVFTNNYSVGGTILSGLVGAYIGYKIGRSKPQKKGFETEKKIGRKIKGAFSKKKYAQGGELDSNALVQYAYIYIDDKKRNSSKALDDMFALLESYNIEIDNNSDDIGNGIGQEYYDDEQLIWTYEFDFNDIPKSRRKDFIKQIEDLEKKHSALSFELQSNTFAKGGGIGFKGLSDKVAKRYAGKKVAPKYQGEYGKRYSKSEAKEVGDKVAGKVYWQQQGRKMAMGGGLAQYPNDLPKAEAERLFHLSHKNAKVGDRLWNNFKRTPLRLIYSNLDERGIKYARGGNVNKGRAWKLDRARINKNEPYEKPMSQRKRKYEDGGQIGQEIVFDDNGEENTGVIKDVTNLGDYIVKADDGRTLLAQRQLDVISLGAMRSASTETPRKRFGFFEEGGSVSGNQNKRFLDSLDVSYKQRVLRNIANHYGISIVEAEEEVTDSESENLYEYITDTSLRMKVYNDMKNRRYAKGGGVSGLDEYKFLLKENDIGIGVYLITKIQAEKIQEIISKRTNSSDKENKYQAIISENNIVVDIANISRKTAIEIQDELDKKMANGADEVITINIQGYPYYLKKMGDTTHFKLANSKEGIDYVIGSHIGQHKGEEYYSDVASWLKGGKSPNGKSYNSFYYAQGGGVSGLDDLIRG